MDGGPGPTDRLAPLVPAGHSGGTRSVWEYLMRTWRAYLFSALVAAIGVPVLYLLAMGVGLGTLVNRGTGSAGLGGVGYLQYIAPALLVGAALQTAFSEATFPTHGRFVWSKVFFAATATPVTPNQVLSGQLLFLATRLSVESTLYYLILVAFRAAGAVAGPLMIPVAVGTALATSVWVLALSAFFKSEGGFPILLRFVLVPMMLFSGSFFPITRMPPAVRWIAWISPLWHGNELARSAALGTGDGLSIAGHSVFLLVVGLAGTLLARRCFRSRLLV